MSPELQRHLIEMGLAPLPPADVKAVLTGVSNQWKPTYPGEEPPF
jgi:hypothetical protein